MDPAFPDTKDINNGEKARSGMCWYKGYGSKAWMVISLMIVVIVFGCDSITPLGFVHGSLYLLAIMAAGLSANIRFVIGVTVLSIALVVLGYFISPSGFESVYVIVNRMVSVVVIAVTGTLAALVVRYLSLVVAQRDIAETASRSLDRAQNLLDIGGRIARIGGWRTTVEGSDPAHWRVIWSDSVRNIIGVPADLEISFNDALDQFTPSHRDRVRDLFIACALDGIPYDTDAEVFREGGSNLWVRLIGEPLRDRTGRIIEVQGAIQDTTDLHEMQERLRAAQRLEVVGQFTGGVAHDFNNLLTVIIGNMEFVKGRVGSDEKAVTLLDMALNAAGRGAELTHRMLAYARRQALDPRAEDVNHLLCDMEPLLGRVLGEHVEIEVVLGAGLKPAMVDVAQLENAVLNLCLNGRDAMPAGGRLTIETANVVLDDDYAVCHEEVVPGRYILVAVSDTGEGMDAGVMRRAFEPFFTTKNHGEGSGLGLSMVFGFIKQSRGHVKIYSEPGQGTTVKLYIPVAEAPVRPAVPRLTPQRIDPVGGVERILMVEDDALVREHVAFMLEDLGYDVVVASNGLDALDVIKRGEAFDLLFTDVIMPGGMDGRQLADEVRKLRPDLPILFTSGYTENAIIHHGRLDPGVSLLQKPYRREDLAAKIRSVLNGADGASPFGRS